MAKPLILASFDDTREMAAQVPSTDYLAGHAAGMADALKAFETQQGALNDELMSLLRDQAFTYHEARHQVLAGMSPLLRTIAETIVPQILHDTLAARLIDALTETCRADGSGHVTLNLSPANAARLGDRLSAGTSLEVTIVADPQLTNDDATWHTGTFEFALDLETLKAAIANAVATILDENEGMHDDNLTTAGPSATVGPA